MAPHNGAEPLPSQAFWSVGEATLRNQLGTGEGGLDTAEARRRLGDREPGRRARSGGPAWMAPLLHQFTSPIILILIGAAVLSFLLDSLTEALIILAIVLKCAH